MPYAGRSIMGIAALVFFTKESAMRVSKVLFVGMASFALHCVVEESSSPAEFPDADPKGSAPAENPSAEDGAEMGGAVPEDLPEAYLHLPFAQSRVVKCVQGVNGSFSHQGRSTKNDLDFDTSNTADEAVFAPASGRAFVHRDVRSTGFGIHVNIDLGDGTYVVVAHLKEAFVQNEVDVVAGQFLGYEGCTGRCTGDHVHVGRHYGSASLPAERGTSVPAFYHIEDFSMESGEGLLASQEFVCGLSDGREYSSILAVPHAHPNGTLVRVPGDPRVYRIDEGKLRWIENEEVFWSYGYRFDYVSLISPDEYACYPIGDPLRAKGMVEAAYDEDSVLWLVVGDRSRLDRYRIRVRPIAWEELLKSWGLSYTRENPPMRFGQDRDFLEFWPVRDGFAAFRDGSVFEETTRTYVISDGIAMPLRNRDTEFLLSLSQEKRSLSEGTLRQVQPRVGSCEDDRFCIGEINVAFCGGLAGFAGRFDDPPPDQSSYDDRFPSGILWVQDPAESDGEPKLLSLEWKTPFDLVARRITLSGEYVFANGSFGFWWRDVATALHTDQIDVTFGGVGSGDRFRFSVEYETENSVVSWSCVGPFPPGRVEGKATADLDGVPVEVRTVDDPTSDGCGLLLEIP